MMKFGRLEAYDKFKVCQLLSQSWEQFKTQKLMFKVGG
mgnify:CR=1 FL=1